LSERILLVRTSALGDIVHCLPVLTALRRHRPGARLAWVVEASMAPLLSGHPDLDEIFVVALRRWRRQPFSLQTLREVAELFGALRRFAPDLTLDLMGNHKAGVLAALTLADRRLGAARRFRREPSSALWLNEGVEPRGKHAVDRALSLLAALDIPAEPADFGRSKLLPEVPEGARERFERHPEPYLLLHPGAGWGNKRYPTAGWGEIARRLRAATGLATWVGVAPGEEGLAAEVVTAAGGAAEAVPASDLATLAALSRRARLVLGGDSGPLHLAHALGTPVLMLCGPTDPERNGPYGAPERALYHRLPCSFCHRRFADIKACLLEIPPSRVAERAAGMLGGTGSAAA